MTKSDNDNDVDQQHPMDDTAIGEATTTTSKPNDDDNRMIHLISKEGDVYEITRAVGMLSQLVKETLGEEDDHDDDDDDEDNNDDDVDGNDHRRRKRNCPEIPLPNVSSTILAKVIDYCQHYHDVEMMTPISTPLSSTKLDDMVQNWYVDYVKVSKNILFDLVSAANFMDVKPLLDLTCLAVSIMIKGKSAIELREMFNISNELTAEEEQQIQRDNHNWLETTTTTPTYDTKDNK